MQVDPRQAATLQRLARLQGLHVAAAAQSLDDARQTQHTAALQEQTAHDALAQQESELAAWLDTGPFDPALLAMKGGQIVAQASALRDATASTAEARRIEQVQARQWQASRYQHDWLHARYSEAAHTLRRKHDEKAAREAIGLTVIRMKGMPA